MLLVFLLAQISFAQKGPVRILPKATSLLMAKGTSQQLNAQKLFFSGGNSTPTLGSNRVKWVSSDSSIVAVDANGNATASTSKLGTATITAISGPFRGNISITVVGATLTSITITVPKSSLAKGQQEQLMATGHLTDGSTPDITSSVTWASANNSLLTVTNTFPDGSAGLVTALQTGNSIGITASMAGKTGNGSITVLSSVLVSLAVNPAPSSVPIHGTLQFTATGTYSDKHTQDLTSASAWTSSNTGVATIGASTGLATATATTGASTIQASAGGINADSSLTVTPPVVGGIAYVLNALSLYSGVPGTVTAYNIDFVTGALTPLIGNSIKSSSVATGVIPIRIAVHPSLNFAYVVNSGDNTVSIYKIDSSTGMLIPNGTASTCAYPVSIAIDPNGTYAYVSCQNNRAGTGAGKVAEFDIGPNGVLTPVGSPLPTGTKPGRAAAYSSIGSVQGFLFVPNTGDSTLSVYGANSGVLTPVSDSPFSTGWAGSAPTAVEVDPSGRFVYAANYQTHSISAYSAVPVYNSGTSPGSGALAPVGVPVTTGVNGPADLAVDPTGHFAYTANITNPPGSPGTVAAFTINPDGTLSANGPIQNTGSDPASVAWDSSARFLYVANSTSNSVTVYPINGANGQIGPSTGSYPTGQWPTAIAILRPVGKTLVSATLIPANATITVGGSLPYALIGNNSDGTSSVITSTASFFAGGTSGAPFSQNVAYAPNPGTFTVQGVSSLGKTGATQLTVTPLPAISSITVSPASATLPVQGALKYTAIANLSGGGTLDVTGIATWASDSNTTATVQSGGTNLGASGTAAAAASGTAHITAKVGSVTSAPPAALTVVSATTYSSIAVKVSPSSAALKPGQTKQFGSSVTGISNTTTTWQADGIPGGNAGVGTVDVTGKYTAPATLPINPLTGHTPPLSVAVTAVSAANPIATGTAYVVVVSNSGAINDVTVSGAHGDGVTDDTNAINKAIGLTRNNEVLYFPCGTYKISNGLTEIDVGNNTAIVGASMNCVTIKATGTGSYTVLHVKGSMDSTITCNSNQFTCAVPLTSAHTAASTFTVAQGALGCPLSKTKLCITAGSYAVVSDVAVESNGVPSPLIQNQETVKVLSVTSGSGGDTATIEGAFAHDFALVSPYPLLQGGAPSVQRLLQPIDGASIFNFSIDASGNTGPSTLGMEVTDAVNSEVGSINISNFLGTGASGGAVIDTGYNDFVHDITCFHCGNGGGNGGPSVDNANESFATWQNIFITNSVAAQPNGVFSFSARETHWSTGTNIVIDAGGVNGRVFKLQRADHNFFNGAVALNGKGLHNGISLTDISQSNTFNNCQAIGNDFNGIALFGNENTNNTFNNCIVMLNVGDAVDTFHSNVVLTTCPAPKLPTDTSCSFNDDSTTVNGGTYCCGRGANALFQVNDKSFTLNGAQLFDDASGLSTNGIVLNSPTGTNIATKDTVKNNTFFHLPSGHDIFVVTVNGVANGFSSDVFSGNAAPDGTNPAGIH